MRKTVLTFGFLSGGVAAGLMLVTMTFVDSLGDRMGAIVGYTGMVLSLLMVFFGIRSYRENAGAGRITFARAFAVGILITLITSACYVATWEFVYFKFMPDFGDKYAAHLVEHAKASGASQDKIEKMTQEAKQFKEMYKNPLINVALTFTEIFPIGFAMTLIAAAILRRKTAGQAGSPA